MRGITRGKTVPGTDVALVTMVLPSILGMTIVYGGLSAPLPASPPTAKTHAVARQSHAEWDARLPRRQDRDVRFDDPAQSLAIVIPGILIVDNLILDARAWLLLALLFVVGMVSTVPWALPSALS